MITGLAIRTFIGGTGQECGLKEVKDYQFPRAGNGSNGMMEVQELILTAGGNRPHHLVFRLFQWTHLSEFL
jgi:hypothetical protein